MAGVQYPYNKKIVTNDIDTVEDDDHNKQEEQLEALTNARGGTWADDLARPTPDANNPHPVGYNVSRSNYEFWDGSAWIQLEIPVNKGIANGYAPLDGSALVPSIYIPPTAPTAHKTSHELGGSDELDLTGLSGTLASSQTPTSHAASHEGGSDPISPFGIGADTPANRDAAIVVHKSDSDAHHTRPVDFELLPKQHKSDHEQAGADQMDLTGLLGILGNAQVPLNHKNNHKTGGIDAFVSADVLQARVKRFEDGGGANWELGVLSPNRPLETDASGNINTVYKNVFGENAQDANDDSQSSFTGSTAYQQKLRLITPFLPFGIYRVGWYFERSCDDENAVTKFRIQMDDMTTLAEPTPVQKKKFADGAWNSDGGFVYITLSSGSYFFDLDYGTNDAGKIVYIRRARLEIWRIS